VLYDNDSQLGFWVLVSFLATTSAPCVEFESGLHSFWQYLFPGKEPDHCGTADEVFNLLVGASGKLQLLQKVCLVCSLVCYDDVMQEIEEVQFVLLLWSFGEWNGSQFARISSNPLFL
jgi:hypothetical protein